MFISLSPELLTSLNPRQDAQNEHCDENNDESRRCNGAFDRWTP